MQRQKIKKWLLIVLVLLVLIVISASISFMAGSADIKLVDLFSVLFSSEDTPQKMILLNIRLPRIILAFAVGGALSMSGALLQGVFRNPLVEPYTLGISGGASLGVTLNIVFKLYLIFGIISFPLSGFTGAVITIFFVYFFSLKQKRIKIESMLLTGVMISFISSSMVMLLMALAKTEDLHGIIFWIMGSLDEQNFTFIIITLLISFLFLVFSLFYSIKLNTLALGEEEAYYLGVDVERTKKVIFVLASVLTGISVSIAGIIGFVGLAIPHLVRFYTGSDYRIFLISSYLAGGAFLIICDLISRTVIAPIELPVGVVTGIIGGMIFIYSLHRNVKQKQG